MILTKKFAALEKKILKNNYISKNVMLGMAFMELRLTKQAIERSEFPG